jgi:hypothetical protein
VVVAQMWGLHSVHVGDHLSQFHCLFGIYLRCLVVKRNPTFVLNSPNTMSGWSRVLQSWSLQLLGFGSAVAAGGDTPVTKTRATILLNWQSFLPLPD